MSMLDDLKATTGKWKPGPLCALQKARRDEGDERFREMLAVCLYEHRTINQKAHILRDNGYPMNDQSVGRHTRYRMEAHNGCVRCYEWYEQNNHDGCVWCDECR